MKKSTKPRKQWRNRLSVFVTPDAGRVATLPPELLGRALRRQAAGDLSPDDVDAALAELETVPNKHGKIRSGPTINRFRMAMQSLIPFRPAKRLLPRGWVSPFTDIPSTRKTPARCVS